MFVKYSFIHSNIAQGLSSFYLHIYFYNYYVVALDKWSVFTIIINGLLQLECWNSMKEWERERERERENSNVCM